MRRSGSLSLAAALIEASTSAPPVISAFMCSIFSAGFSEIPPVSKVIVFPTSTTGRSSFFLAPLYSRMMNLGGSWLPRATPSNAPIPKRSISFCSRILIVIPSALAMALRFVGDPGGRQDVGGMITEVSDKDGGLCRGDAAPDPFGHLPQLTLPRDENLHARDVCALRQLRFDRR